MYKKYRSALSQAKGLGPGKSGVKHWWYQRLTAIILIITSVWLIWFIKSITNQDIITHIVIIIQKPYNIVMLLMTVIFGFYHAILGLQIIIEDYIKSHMIVIFMIISIKIFAIVTVFSFIVAILFLINS